MKLIASNNELKKQLSRLLQNCTSVEFAVAWASANTTFFDQLIVNHAKIKRAIIGTHFYQTHPDVLDAFVGFSKVRFIKQPDGVFHPKVFLFRTGNTWEALIGSANLTFAALSSNSEIMVLLSSSDLSAPEFISGLQQSLAKYWDEAKPATKETAKAYRAIWMRMQPALRRLSGQYGKANAKKSPIESSVMSMSWDGFLETLIASGQSELDERTSFLKRVHSAFLDHARFSQMDLEVRQTIAGMPNNHDRYWGWFGSMKGAGYFKQAVNQNSPHLSEALDSIPLQGMVSRSQYDQYISNFIRAFSKGRHGVATASRLLALKRPDLFVCLDSKNRHELSKNFGIASTGIDYERYWEDIIERIIDTPWWNSPRPRNDIAANIWDGRAAMLDAIFYRP